VSDNDNAITDYNNNNNNNSNNNRIDVNYGRAYNIVDYDDDDDDGIDQLDIGQHVADTSTR
jgi:hypothetical protein